MTDEQHAVEEVEELYRRRDEPDARATAESRIELPLMASKLKSFPLKHIDDGFFGGETKEEKRANNKMMAGSTGIMHYNGTIGRIELTFMRSGKTFNPLSGTRAPDRSWYRSSVTGS